MTVSRVPYQSVRHVQRSERVSILELTPCRTNHRTIKAEHLGAQNKMVQTQSRFPSAHDHALHMFLVR